MPRLNQQSRNRALGMIDGGASIREVACHFNVDMSTIVRLRRRYNTTGSVADRPRQGRPRVLTPADERFIRLSSLRNLIGSMQARLQACIRSNGGHIPN